VSKFASIGKNAIVERVAIIGQPRSTRRPWCRRRPIRGLVTGRPDAAKPPWN